MVSLNYVIRWAQSYGLDPSIITGLRFNPHGTEVTSVTPVTNVTAKENFILEGIL